MHNSHVKPTVEQQAILRLIYDEFQRTGQAPTFQWIDKRADRDGLQLRKILSTMPPGLMTPDPGWSNGYYWRPETELLPTAQGLLYCGDDAEQDLALLARVLRYFADREQAFTPSNPNLAEQIDITASEIASDLDLTELELAKTYTLLTQFEVQMRFGSGYAAPTEWSWTLDGEQIRKYRGISDSMTYLQARGDLPTPIATDLVGRLTERAERVELHVRGLVLRTSQRAPRTLATIARHPLTVALVASLVTYLLTRR